MLPATRFGAGIGPWHRCSHAPRIPRLGRFGWLMALACGEPSSPVRLLAPANSRSAVISSIGDGLRPAPGRGEQHRHTSELRLTYAMVDAATGAPDPSAFVRLYRDARQAEATHCHVGRRWQDAIGMHPPSDAPIRHCLRMNTFLGKWLDYLGEQGHGVARLRLLADAPAEISLTLPERHR